MLIKIDIDTNYCFISLFGHALSLLMVQFEVNLLDNKTSFKKIGFKEKIEYIPPFYNKQGTQLSLVNNQMISSTEIFSHK